MFNTNRPLNQNPPTSNVDWSALADSWMQQREQQTQWQQMPPLPPPPPPPQFLLTGPPLRPPGLPPIGIQFHPHLHPNPMAITGHHHQLQVGSNTAQESLTMTNIENPHWGAQLQPSLPPPPPPPLPPHLIASSAPPWRPNPPPPVPPIFPVQPVGDISSPYGNRNFWPNNQHTVPVQPSPIPPPATFGNNKFTNSPVDKRTLNSSTNATIPSLMDVSSPYKQKSKAPPTPVVVSESVHSSVTNNKTNGSANRPKFPLWLREELSRIEKEKEKKLKISQVQTNSSIKNGCRSKFDDPSDDETIEESKCTKRRSRFADNISDNEDEEEEEQRNSDRSPTSGMNSATSVLTRRTRFDDDDDQLNEVQPTTEGNNPIENQEEEEEEENLNEKLQRTSGDLVLDLIDEEITSVIREVYLQLKSETSKAVILKAPGFTSLIQSSYGSSDSSDDEKSKIFKDENCEKNEIPLKKNKNEEQEEKTSKNKKKKSNRERSRSSSSSSSNKRKRTRNNEKKKSRHRRRRSSSSSSSDSRQRRSSKTSDYHKRKR